MKKTLLLLLLLPFCFAAAAEGAIDRAWVERNYRKTEYRIPMRDGVRLHTTVYAPGDTAGRHPILLTRTPYSCRPYGAEFSASLWKSFLKLYLEEGYILVFQDVRGRYMSEGEYVDLRPFIADKHSPEQIDEASDAYDTIDFLVREVAGNNGRVGVYGNSYPGFYALMAAASGHPALKAASPQAPVTDWFMGDDVRHNGVLMLTDSYRFLSGMNTPPGHTPTEKMPSMSKRTRPDEWTFFREHATLAELTELQRPNPFWEELAEHSSYDAWWQARDLRRACYNVQPAVLVVGGTFDAEDCFGAWNLYRAMVRQSPATPCHLVVGPWAHGAWRNGSGKLGAFDFGREAAWEYYMEHFELPFFDHYLKGEGAAAPLPAAAVFSSGDNRWHTFGRWTPSEARKLTLYLADGGRITTEKPTVKNSSTSYTSDPADPVPYIATSGTRRPKEYMIADQRFLEGRKDVLTFVTEPLAEDVTLAGPVEASLKVALSTSDADFVVKLIDVYPDEGEKAGMQMLVRGDVVRGRYRDGFTRPKAFVPGSPETVPFRTTDIAHTFRAGHRIMVQVQSSWFPLTERNPQQYVDLWRCAASDFVPCRVTLFHQRDRASSLTVYKL